MTEAFRSKVVDYVLHHFDESCSVAELAAKIGIHPRTLWTWLDEHAPQPALAPVVVVEPLVEPLVEPTVERAARPSSEAVEVLPSRPIVVLPNGTRIEGLDVAAIAELLRRLG